jgi:hypothetical protein
MGDPENGRPAAEAIFNRNHPNPRIASELAGHAALENGVDLRVVRLPQVHDTRRQGSFPITFSFAGKKALRPGLTREQTAGRLPMLTMWPGCTAPFLRKDRAVSVITRWLKRRYRQK